MLFNSYGFLLFFPIVTLVYFLVPHKYRHIWLLLASYFFYMSWDAKYASILFLSTIVTYICGRLVQGTKNKKRRKLYVGLSFIINIGILFFFKYFDFAIDNINTVLGAFNLGVLNPAFDIVLPVGISFYIFQALGYTIDVYRKDVKAEKNFLKYALFVSFFPQLVAGPIERSKNLLKQIHDKHHFNFARARDGFMLMAWGMFQKIVIADRLAIIVNKIFNSPADYGGLYVVIGVVLFAFQIYCDFAGYSTIAQGAAKVMGFNLMDNFNSPYMARSIKDFWRRWHISLTTWFTDYLYIPLGGNRKGKLRKYLNTMIVFLTSGLWHGASWHYVVWGGLNGLYLIFADLFKKPKQWLCQKLRLHSESAGHKALQIVITFSLICITWIFFRAGGVESALMMLRNIFAEFNPWILFDGSLFKLGLNNLEFNVMIIALIIMIFVDVVHWKGLNIRNWIYKQDRWLRWSFYILVIMSILIFGIWGSNYVESAFIYFQF